MACEPTRRTHLLIAALVAVLAALWIPATGHAAARDRLASAGVLERGSGYQSAGGSDAVRILQRRLRRLGNEPGPIDGFYGPLTQGAVERFQQRHGLAADGVVGRQTRRSLFSGSSQPTASPAQRGTQPGTLTRKSPAPSIGSESAIEQPHARPVPAEAASRAGPASGTSGVPPEAIAALAALAGIVLVLTLRRQGEVRLNLGVTCAALLGVFGIGAVAGAIFATRAAPHGTDRATAQSGLLADSATRGSARHAASASRWAHPDRVKVPTELAAAPARPARTSTRPAPPIALALAPAISPVAPPAPLARSAPPASARAPVSRAKPPTYVVKLGDSLSDIARTRLSAGSDARVVAEVQRLAQLNLDGRIRSGDPDVLETGEELRLP
jgi:peptidoglycan hydrolase-like protein with peptidoglycan-binding domain